MNGHYMKVAIPTWQGRISPVFDVAYRLLVLELDGGNEVSRQEVKVRAANPEEWAEELLSLGVTRLICGAISRPLDEALRNAGIEVIGFVCGEVETVATALSSGSSEAWRFAMPGCRGRRRRGRIRGHKADRSQGRRGGRRC